MSVSRIRSQIIAAIAFSGCLLVGCIGDDEEALRAEQTDLLGFFDPGDVGALLEFRFAAELRAEELIVECMAGAGFDYHPAPPLDDPRIDDMTDAEYRERYGWGMMSSWRGSLTPNRSEPDPNEVMLATMDDPTRAAWEETLYGTPEAQLDPDRREGCQAEADARAHGYEQTDAWAELQPLLEEIPERIVAHPRSIEAEREWSACMAERGFRVANRDELLEVFNDHFYDTWEAQTPPPGEKPIEYRYSVEPWFVDTPAWDELVAFELEMIAHDTACSQDDDVVIEIQQEFLDEHQDLIRQYQSELEHLERQR